MEYVNLGATGLRVSRVCLGMMSFGDDSDRAWVLGTAGFALHGCGQLREALAAFHAAFGQYQEQSDHRYAHACAINLS